MSNTKSPEDFFSEGVSYFNNGQYGNAIKSFDKAIELKTDIAEAYYYRGAWYVYKEEYDKAIQDYDKAIELKPDFALAYYDRGVAYLSKEEYDRAILDFDKAIELKPDFADAYINRGLSYDKKEEYDRAIQDYDKAIELKPDFADAYCNRGLSYARKEEYDRAILDYDKAIELKLDFADAYYNRGSVYYEKEEYARAFQDFDKAIELRPDFEDAYYNRGAVYHEKEEYDRAIQDFDKAIELNPDYKGAYLNRGIVYSEKKEYDRAIQDFDKAIELKPKFANAYYNRGSVYYEKEEYDRAIQDFDKAIELKSDFAQAYFRRGLLYDKKEEYGRAIPDFDKAIELKPDFAQAYFKRGLSYVKKEEYGRAIPDFDKAIELKPDFADAYLNRGFVYDEKEEYDRAIPDFDKAIELKPDFAQAYYNRGLSYAKKEEYDKAIQNFDKAIELKPDDAEAYHSRGLSYYDKEEYVRAIQDFDKAIEIKPRFPDPHWTKASILLKRQEFDLAFRYLLRYYFLESRYKFLNKCFNFITKIRDNNYSAPLFVYRVFLENPVLFTSISLEHFYTEIFDECEEKMSIIIAIDNGIFGLDEIKRYKIKGLIYYFYDDPMLSQEMFNQIDTLDGTDLMGQYYLLMSLIQYLEDYSGEIETALEQCNKVLGNNTSDNVHLYYAGMIYLLRDDIDSALKCFNNSIDFLPSRFMLVQVYDRLNRLDEKEKCIISILDIENDDERDEIKLLLNGKLLEINLDDKDWGNTILFNAHVNEISDARKIIFDWLDDDQNKESYPHYWEKGLIFDYTPESEIKAYRIWKATEETSIKLKEIAPSISSKELKKLESKVDEAFPNMLQFLERLDSKDLEIWIADKIQSEKISKVGMEKYSILIAYYFLHGKLSIHQNIFLNSYLVVKFHIDSKSKMKIGQKFFEAAILYSVVGPLTGLLTLQSGILYVTAHSLLHALCQVYYNMAESFLKTELKEKILHQKHDSKHLLYTEFKEMYIEYVSNIKMEEGDDIFETWNMKGLKEWYEANK